VSPCEPRSIFLFYSSISTAHILPCETAESGEQYFSLLVFEKYCAYSSLQAQSYPDSSISLFYSLENTARIPRSKPVVSGEQYFSLLFFNKYCAYSLQQASRIQRAVFFSFIL